MDILPNWIVAVIVSIFGLALGSFVSAISWRLPRDISVINDKKISSSKRSFCPNCKTKLRFFDLIPVISWLIARGRCRYCLQKISIRYPLIEISTAILMLIFYFSLPEIHSSWLELAIFTSLSVSLIIMATIDFEHKILPNSLNLIIAILGIAYIITNNVYNLELLQEKIITALINSILYASIAIFIRWIFLIITKKDALGFGDIKFFAAVGIWLDLNQLPIFMMLSGLAGILIGIIWKKLTKENIFPFGPALILAFVICLSFGKNISLYFL